MLHSHYGGRLEEFCKAYCMSQFTVLYYGVRTRTDVDPDGGDDDDDDNGLTVLLLRWEGATVAGSRAT